MIERPILFSAPMVLALLNGCKTQTRRVAKLTANGHVKEQSGNRRWHPADFDVGLACPYGQPGDRLWVRETFANIAMYRDAPLLADRQSDFAYRASGDNIGCHKWKPSIHMPRVASRITLEITSVRVEHVQDISKEDALTEGIVPLHEGFGLPDGIHFHASDPRESYLSLWNAINGEGSAWNNPWVWVVEFKRLQGAKP